MRRSSFLALSLCVLCWLQLLVVVQAQPQVQVTGTSLSIGSTPTPPSGSSSKLQGLATRSAGQELLAVDASGNVGKGALGIPDIPSVFTRRDVAETIGALWRFDVGARVQHVRGTSNPFIVYDAPGTNQRLQVYDSDIARHASTTTNAYEEFYSGGHPAGFGSKYFRAGNIGGAYAVDMISNAYGAATRGFEVSGFGDTGTATDFRFGPNVQQVYPGRQLYTDLGMYLWPFRALHVGELRASTMVVNETQAYTEASLKIGRGSTLSRDVSSSFTEGYIYTKTNATRYLDFLILRTLNASGQPQFEVMRVTGASYSDCTGAVTPLPGACYGVDNDDFAVYVNRNQDGSGANEWKVGDAIVSMDRWIDIFSDASGTVSYGSNVLADRPVAYWNFAPADAKGTVIPQPNRSRGPRGYSGPTTTLVPQPGVSIGPGGCGWNGCNEEPPYGAWYSTTSGDFTMATPVQSVPEIDTVAFMYSMSVEFVLHTGNTPHAGYAWNPVSEWVYGDTSKASFVVYIYGAQSGVVNTVAMYGTVMTAGGPVWTNLTPSAQLNPNSWYHIVCTWDISNGGRIYVNGTQQGSVTPNVGGPSSPRYNSGGGDTSLRVMGFMNAGDGYGTHFGELALYDYELNAQQVRAHFNALSVQRASTTNGPTMVGWLGGGANWYDMAPRWAAGNLVGLYDYPSETYGFAAGDYTKTWIASDAANGFRVMYGNTQKMRADTSGNLTIDGSITGPTYSITPTTGVQVLKQAFTTFDIGRAISVVDTLGSTATPLVALYTNTNGTSMLHQRPGTSLLLGDEPTGFDSFSSNTRIWNDGSTSSFGAAGSGVTFGAAGIEFNVSESSGSHSTLHAFVRPATDAAMTLGYPTQRWRNIHLSLPSIPYQSAPNGGAIVGLDPSDLTRLGYINWGMGRTGGVGIPVRNAAGTATCHIYVYWGLVAETSCT